MHTIVDAALVVFLIAICVWGAGMLLYLMVDATGEVWDEIQRARRNRAKRSARRGH